LVEVRAFRIKANRNGLVVIKVRDRDRGPLVLAQININLRPHDFTARQIEHVPMQPQHRAREAQVHAPPVPVVN